MAALLIVVLVLFALGILGAVVKGLLWLTVVAAIAVVVTIAFGFLRHRGGAHR